MALLLFGCATDRGTLTGAAGGIEERTGHGIRAEHDIDAGALPSGVDLADGLGEEEAVALALWNNPDFRSALADLGVVRAQVIQAGQLSNPSFSMLFPVGPKQLEFAARMPLEALWLRGRRVEIARLDYQRVAEALVQNGLNVGRDARMACSDLWLALERERLAGREAELLEEIAELRGKEQEIGAVGELVFRQAQMDEANAKQAVSAARGEVDLAEQALRLLIGLGESETSVNWALETPTLDRLPALTALVSAGLASRPDLRAAELAIETAGKRMGLAEKEIFQLIGVVDVNGGNGAGNAFEIGPGLDVLLPIFHQNQGQVAAAEAAAEKAFREYSAVRMRVVGDIQRPLLAIQRERENLTQIRAEILPVARTLIEQSKRAHELGAVSQLVELRAELQLVAGQRLEAEAKARHHRALAELERGVGLRWSDIQSIGLKGTK